MIIWADTLHKICHDTFKLMIIVKLVVVVLIILNVTYQQKNKWKSLEDQYKLVQKSEPSQLMT